MDSTTVSMLALGGSALFGLQGSLGLVVRHYLFRNNLQHAPCDRLLLTQQAYLGPIPVSLFAVIYYSLVLLMLFFMLTGGENPMDLLTPLILISIPFTCYYAWLLFFKLRLVCIGCVRIYLANLLMAVACAAYFWFV